MAYATTEKKAAYQARYYRTNRARLRAAARKRYETNRARILEIKAIKYAAKVQRAA